MYWKIFILVVAIYLLLRFIFRFVMPLLKVTHAATRKINEMRKQMEQSQNSNNNSSHQQSVPQQRRDMDGEYIDYEELNR